MIPNSENPQQKDKINMDVLKYRARMKLKISKLQFYTKGVMQE